MAGNFRCIHCGEYFNIDRDEQEIYEEGFFAHEPDCCEECYQMMAYPSHDIMDTHSDADTGL